MNILFHDYGGYAFTHQVARRLSRNHNITYLYSSGQLVKRCSNARTPTFTSRSISAGRPLDKYNLISRYLWERDYGKALAGLIYKEHPQVVVSANTPLDSQAMIARACRETGARFVFWFQDAIGLAMETVLSRKIPIAGKLVGSYYKRLELCLLDQSDSIILISPGFYPLIDRWGIDRSKTRVIPNWAPLEEIPMQPPDNPWSREHDLAGSINLLYSGILGYKHNPAMFIRLAEHFQADKRVKVVVVSEGGGADWLRGQQEKRKLPNLVLLPFQPSVVFPQVLASAAILLSLINAEASQYSVPSKVLSYLCAGRPVLLSISSKNEAAGIIENALAGFVSEPGNMSGWLEQAGTLVNKPGLRKIMGKNARSYAETNFAIDPICHQFEQILSQYE